MYCIVITVIVTCVEVMPRGYSSSRVVSVTGETQNKLFTMNQDNWGAREPGGPRAKTEHNS